MNPAFSHSAEFASWCAPLDHFRCANHRCQGNVQIARPQQASEACGKSNALDECLHRTRIERSNDKKWFQNLQPSPKSMRVTDLSRRNSTLFRWLNYDAQHKDWVRGKILKTLLTKGKNLRAMKEDKKREIEAKWNQLISETNKPKKLNGQIKQATISAKVIRRRKGNPDLHIH